MTVGYELSTDENALAERLVQSAIKQAGSYDFEHGGDGSGYQPFAYVSLLKSLMDWEDVPTRVETEFKRQMNRRGWWVRAANKIGRAHV